MPYQQVGGMMPQIYHTLPNTLDEISTNPLKENIFKMLGQISYDQFPEFVADILVKVEGHKLFDITDGQGDEKQDILTFNRAGKRCLTQCKHTINYSTHYNGDELDLMVVTCMRKNCKEAIFVTNSDLTPQGKKYVSDKEYERGQPDTTNLITVDYWNDIRLWERIKNNADILHKWFSGLGQTHGLRFFRFDVGIKQLPATGSLKDKQVYQLILAELLKKKLVVADAENLIYTGRFNDHAYSIRPGIQIDTQLGLNYSNPQEENLLYNQAIRTLSIDIIVSDVLDKYDPVDIRNQIINHLFNPVLHDLNGGKWWHVVASQSTSFVFLHEIGEPREIILHPGHSYLKTKEYPITSELEYCSLHADEFKLKDKEDDDDSIWVHNQSGVEVIQMFDQRLDPVEVYNHQVIQMHNIDTFKTYNFNAVEGVDEKLLMRVRRFIPNSWTAFQFKHDTLLWGVPPEAEIKDIELVNKKISLLGLDILTVKDDDRDDLLSKLKNDMPPHTSVYISGLKSLTFPVDLTSRIFWLQKDLKIERNISFQLAMRLTEFKFGFDKMNGYDNMRGQNQMNTHTSELREILFDYLSIRGTKMMDIAIYNNPITLSIRYRENKTEPSHELTIGYISEFLTAFEELKQLIAEMPVDDIEE